MRPSFYAWSDGIMNRIMQSKKEESNLENDIWDVLGIEYTQDQVAIKKAYAAKAHTMNPEDEPERFRVLHDAYRAALSIARGEITSSGANSVRTDNRLKQEPVDTCKDEYNFGDVDNLSSSSESVANAIIDDILHLRNTNKLDSKQGLYSIPENVKTDLAMQLFAKYKELVRVTGNRGMYYSFFDEPLIAYCSRKIGFQSWILNSFTPNSKDRAVIAEILVERGYVVKEEKTVIIPDDPKRIKKEKIFITVAIITGALLLFGICVLAVLTDDMSIGDMLRAIGMLAVVMLVSVLGVIIGIASGNSRGVFNGSHRNRSGHDKQSGMHMER